MAGEVRLHNLADCVVFFDFDNTITPFDVLDDIIRRFSINRDWEKTEKLWKARKIGSGECLTRQIENVRVTKSALEKYLKGIKIDPYFHKLTALLAREGIKPVILSDDFSFIIKTILKNNGVENVKVFCNSLRFSRDRLLPSFPHTDKSCISCAHCKRNNLLKKSREDNIIIYAGDGLSDICPALHSDIIFAKGSLLEHFRKEKKMCIRFNSLRDIYNYMEVFEK